MNFRATPIHVIELNGLRGFGFSVFIDRDEASHSEQARFPSQGALEADPVGSLPLAGSADQFNDTGPHVFSDQEPVA